MLFSYVTSWQHYHHAVFFQPLPSGSFPDLRYIQLDEAASILTGDVSEPIVITPGFPFGLNSHNRVIVSMNGISDLSKTL